MTHTSCQHGAVVKISVPDGLGVVVVGADVVVTVVVGTAAVVVDSAAADTEAHIRPFYDHYAACKHS